MRSETDTEQLIFESMPHSPVELRRLIEQQVSSNIRRQTRINDCKWLGLTYGSFALALLGIWLIARSTQAQLQEFCRTEISSPETTKFLMVYLGNPKMSNSEAVAPRDEPELIIPKT